MAEPDPRPVVGIDIGGTRLKLALVDHPGTSQARVIRRRIHTLRPADCTPAALVARLRRAVLDLADEEGGAVLGAGIGVPGVLDAAAGRVCDSPNLPWLDDFPLGASLGQALGLPVQVDNDVNCIAWGEATTGVGRGVPDQLCLALGTGVGGGVVLGGQLFRGGRGRGAEFGHLCVDPLGPPCGCGGRGCLEQYASQTGLLRLMRDFELTEGPQDGGPEDIPRLFSLAAAGDPAAGQAVLRAGAALGQAIASLLRVFDVPLIVISGGIAEALPSLRPPLERSLARQGPSIHHSGVRIVAGTLGPDAGCLGAAALHQASLVG